MAKRKHILIALIIAGSLLISTAHSTAMMLNMDSMECLAQVSCGACAILVVPDSKPVSHLFSALEGLADTPFQLMEPHSLTLYHPPR